MIQFLGLHLGLERATAVALGRDLQLWAEAAAPVVNVARDPALGAAEVPPAEWVRSGCYVLQEAYFQLPVSARKVWGLGLAGPSGWIALDRHFEPLSPLRLTGSAPAAEDLHRWMQENPRLARRTGVVLSPKDYFRFAVSGGLAADVTDASREGLLQDEASQWSEERAAARDLELEWLPPVFDSPVATGRLSEEGVRRTSLPGGLWLVAGAHEVEAALVAAGDLRRRVLYRLARPGAPPLLAFGIEGLAPPAAPPPWQVRRFALPGTQALERELEEPAAAAGGLAEIQGAGFEAERVEEVEGRPEVGAAALAAVGSDLVKGWDRYYRDRPAPPGG